jgi:hypothetical protein
MYLALVVVGRCPQVSLTYSLKYGELAEEEEAMEIAVVVVRAQAAAPAAMFQ